MYKRKLFKHSPSMMFAVENRLFERVSLLNILIEMKLVKLYLQTRKLPTVELERNRLVKKVALLTV